MARDTFLSNQKKAFELGGITMLVSFPIQFPPSNDSQMPISFWNLAPPSLVATSFYDTLLPIVSPPLPSKGNLAHGSGEETGTILDGAMHGNQVPEGRRVFSFLKKSLFEFLQTGVFISLLRNCLKNCQL